MTPDEFGLIKDALTRVELNLTSINTGLNVLERRIAILESLGIGQLHEKIHMLETEIAILKDQAGRARWGMDRIIESAFKFIVGLAVGFLLWKMTR